MRRPSQTSAYFAQALDALASASTAAALYVPVPSYLQRSLLESSQRSLTARNRRLNFLRNTVLFAALAAEAYANEFLAAVLSPADAKALDRLEPAEKMLIGSRMAGQNVALARGTQPFQDLAQLSKTRNALVHPRRSGISAYVQNVTDEDQRRVGPRAAVAAIYAVASAIDLLEPLTPPPHMLGEARMVAEHRIVLDRHVGIVGASIFDLPSPNAASPDSLMEQVRKRVAEKAAKTRQQTKET